MSKPTASISTVSSLLGLPVHDAAGKTLGRVYDLVVDPAHNATHVAYISLDKVRSGQEAPIRAVAISDIDCSEHSLHVQNGITIHEIHINSMLLLEQDVLDQQIIDVNGHKVVRVNDVDLVWESDASGSRSLRIAEVEVGMRGAVRRLLKGIPGGVVNGAAHRFQQRCIPWEFVDLIDRDPSRRVRLKVEQNRLANMHPSDIADILEDLAPAEREAVFGSLDEELAAEALEEIEPKLQKALIENLDSERAAGIVEEMDPGAAADLLSELSEERSEAILEEMDPEERQEVEDLLEFPGNWAAGRMTTDFVQVPEDATVAAAIDAIRTFEGDTDVITEVLLTNAEDQLKGVVSLANILLADSATPLATITDRKKVSCEVNASGKHVAELFDKYNLRTLPVLNRDHKLVGVIYAEQVIATLRAEQ